MGEGKVGITPTGEISRWACFRIMASRGFAFVCADLEEEEMTDSLVMVREFHEAFDISVATYAGMEQS